MKGRSLRASVNGKIILDVTADACATFPDGSLPGLNRTKGRIGLQKHTGTVRFRNIQVKSLDAPVSLALARQESPRPDPAKAQLAAVPSNDETGFRTLFNGRDLSGWAVDGDDASAWRVEDGEIVAVGHGFANSDFLLSDHDYRDVVLRFDFKVGPNANSGVGIRAIRGERVDGRPRNLEVQIHDDQDLAPGQGEPTGSLFWSSGGPMMRPFKHPRPQTSRRMEQHGGRGPGRIILRGREWSVRTSYRPRAPPHEAESLARRLQGRWPHRVTEAHRRGPVSQHPDQGAHASTGPGDRCRRSYQLGGAARFSRPTVRI